MGFRLRGFSLVLEMIQDPFDNHRFFDTGNDVYGLTSSSDQVSIPILNMTLREKQTWKHLYPEGPERVVDRAVVGGALGEVL